MSGPSDSELVSAAQEGDRDAFADLVRLHHPNVYGLCLGMLGDPAAADDAAQEAFLSAWKALKSFKGDSAFGTWLHRIAANKCLDALRRSARRGEDSLDAILEGGGSRSESVQAGGRGPEEAAAAADLSAKVMGSLSDEYRLVLTLREVQGLSYEEIMTVMDCSLDSVKARLRRAREAALERLRHFSGGGGVL
ncbi:sigma-70 family RNA polymerase sigma factor [bacterium]|nr:MAG: sigma-70 family RNA polymerase sigma factor [bacterium]